MQTETAPRKLSGMITLLHADWVLFRARTGMGPDESERMVELLMGLRGSMTILLVEHDMDAVFRLADRISTLVFGKVIACGTPQAIRENPEVKRAYLGDELTEEVA